MPRIRAVSLFVLLLSGIAACTQSSADARVDSTAATERPEWGFGEGSMRTDSLPKELDNLWEWGGYPEDERPVAYAIDLNGDGREEFLVRAHASECGPRGGCPMRLMTRGANGQFTDLLDGIAKVLYVTNHRANGWPVLWTVRGGPDGGLFRLELRGTAYATTATLRRNSDTNDWTHERMEGDSLWRALSAAELR